MHLPERECPTCDRLRVYMWGTADNKIIQYLCTTCMTYSLYTEEQHD